jgi:hypothetical protein
MGEVEGDAMCAATRLTVWDRHGREREDAGLQDGLDGEERGLGTVEDGEENRVGRVLVGLMVFGYVCV